MAEIAQPFGNVTSASTTVAVRATFNAPAILGQLVTDKYSCGAIQFQALAPNTGIVYICDRETPALTLHVLAAIPVPATGNLPAWVIGNPETDNYDLKNFWILPAVANDGVNVTAVPAKYL